MRNRSSTMGRVLVALLIVMAWRSMPVAGRLPVMVGMARAEVGAEAVAATASNAGHCSTCHPRERVAFEPSVHGRGAVTCVSCHGGDADSRDVEAAHRKPFTGRPARRDIPALCAECHADIDRMKSYNLPTDQLALYQISGHGKRLAQGDEGVAVCSDCHGVHDTRTVSDPLSRAHRRNIPATCGACHDDEAVMEPYGGTTKPSAAYLGSIHARQLYDSANQKAPVCVDCHGVHSATPPAYGDIFRVCGRCHATTRRHFVAGPHGHEMEAAGLPGCSSCHDHHAIDTTPGDSFDDICQSCHESGSRGAEVGGRIEVLMQTAADEILQADSLVAVAAKVPLVVDDYRARLEEARTYLTEARPISHRVDVESVDEMTRRARSIAGEVESEIIGRLRDLSLRRFGLLAFWFYVLLTIAVLIDLRRREQG